jgi:hypothetical protein
MSILTCESAKTLGDRMCRFHSFMKIFSSVDTSSNSSISFSDRPTLHSSSISSAQRKEV